MVLGDRPLSCSRRRFLAWCGGAGVVLASCGPSSNSSGTVAGGNSNQRIAMGITDRIRTLDPADAFEPVSLNILLNLGETLYTYAPGQTELEPLLARKMPTVSDGGTTYRIPLREGVWFHDGSAFNAEAMAFSLQRFVRNGGRPAFLLADNVRSITATGELELTIRLSSPFSAFTAVLAFPGTCAVSPAAHAIGEFTPEAVVATGRYRLQDYAENSRLVLDRHEAYWGEPALNEGIDIQFFNTGATLLNAFKSGSIDLAFQTLEPNQIQTLLDERETRNWQVASQTSSLIRYLVLNVTQPPLDRLEVRQAIAAAINRTLLEERVFLNQASPLYSLIPNTVAGAQPAFLTAYEEHAIDTAKSLLLDAGFSPGNPAVTTLWHAAGNSRGELIASTLKASLEADLAGLFELELRSVEAATLFSNLDKGIYPMVLLSWAPDFIDPDNYLHPFVSCDRAEDGICTAGSTYLHGSYFYDRTIDNLVRQQRLETDARARADLLAEVQQQIADRVPFIPLVQGVDYIFGAPQVSGLQLTGAQAVPLWLVAKGS
ncbi:ABC transporter substrate-binding protein [Synechococcus sp. PCC 7336]|uniref:ABC transporter substrate-binding protein n=1 Tax=Synechococcus sp. PCC 7336 TaxID=195250 RepID=UPI00034B2AE4|nr:ABC transporter substrate-binding protein [Synechococcus sp. PCC 7336]